MMTNKISRWTWAVGIFVTMVFFAHSAAAQQFEYSLKNKVQAGEGKPSITVRTPRSVQDARVLFERSDGHKKTVKLGDLRYGEIKEIPIDQPTGIFSYKATISGKDAQNEPISMEITFDVAYIAAMTLQIDREQVDVGLGRLPFRSNRPVERAHIEVFDEKGVQQIDRNQMFEGRSGDLVAEWDAFEGVGAIRLTVHDVDGFWSAVILEPFWVQIPHQTVVFEFGKDTWTKDEIPKLEKTLADIKKAMAEHAGKGLEMQLYIAGYTDTVGTPQSNQRLSTARARAIARWFRQNGLSIPIYYQGFGQSVLAVDTPDETNEARNRRAIYVLGNSPPPTS
ncbi:MAG: OmpA family protein, partial [Bradymonadaceae bacterium]